MLKRFFDFLVSAVALIILSPVFLIISILIIIDSRGGVFFRQSRVGKDSVDFFILKFRTMVTGSEKSGLLTIGGRDSRVTRIGYYLRKYKLDEFPQLLNVLVGDMSLVGPRPEVRKYVDLYTDQQKIVLSVRPGITDLASIEYSNENDLLAQSDNPEQLYVNTILPAKLALNLIYISEQNFFTDIKIIFKTVFKVWR